MPGVPPPAPLKDPGLVQDLIGPVQGRWLEFFFVPLAVCASLAAGFMALWWTLAGHILPTPWPAMVVFALLVAGMGVFVASLQASGRIEKVGAHVELLVVVVLPFAWYWGWWVLTRLFPATFGPVATHDPSGAAAATAAIGALTWTCGHLAGSQAAAAWPLADNRVRVLWLMDQLPPMEADEDREVAIAKARIASAEQAAPALAWVLLGSSCALVVLGALVPTAHMVGRSHFVAWGAAQVGFALIATAGFRLAVSRLRWVLHGTRVETGVVNAWVLALVASVALLLPLGIGISASYRAISAGLAHEERGRIQQPRTTGSGLTANDREHLASGDQRLGSSDTAKGKASAPKREPKAKRKKSKSLTTPQAVQSLLRLMLAVVLGGVLVSSLLLGASLAAVILVGLANFAPGILGLFGAGARSLRGRSLLQAMTWPAMVVAEFLGQGTRELIRALRGGLRRRVGAAGAVRAVRAGGAGAAGRLAAAREARRLRSEALSTEPRRAVIYTYLAALHRAERRGLNRQPPDTSSELSRALSSPPDIANDVEALTQAFERARYSGRAPDAGLLHSAVAWARIVARRFRARRR